LKGHGFSRAETNIESAALTAEVRPQGLKAIDWEHVAARLKPCPFKDDWAVFNATEFQRTENINGALLGAE
jgi:hypothetical protein